ncbi:MAG TPA: response regulator [Candidatus Angelobacter sp.]|nr:response regulator [Candidatus Angelobacter sp.]
MQLKEASILIVDDEPVLLEIWGEWFKRVAGQVFCTENGLQALQILTKHKIDLICTDIRMPVMDGISLLKKLKERALYAPRVIFVTGFSNIQAREAYELGAEAVLEKPIERDDVINAVKRCLTDRNELWQTPPALAAYPTLTGSFESLATALQEHRIAVGRGGFCIETEQFLVEGPVNIKLDFKTDQYVLLGTGIVRWLAPQERLMGIELTYVAEASRSRMLQLAEQSASFIPRTTGRTYQARAG